MQITETGLFLDKIPFMQIGDAENPILVLNGGQAFVSRFDPRRVARDARRIARILPQGASFVLLGYNAQPPADHTLDDVVGDVATIARMRWSGPATVMGISYGGLTAVRLAARHPELVGRLILMASAHRFSAAGRERVLRQIACAERGDLRGLAGGFVAIFRRRWLNALLRLSLWLDRNALDRKINDPDIIVRSLRAVIASDVDRQPVPFAAISAKTLIVGGADDQFFGDGAMDEAARLIPGSQLALLAHETHMAPIERARDIARVMSRFLQA